MADKELVDKCPRSLISQGVTQRLFSKPALEVPPWDSCPLAHWGDLVDEESLCLPSLPSLIFLLPDLCFLDSPPWQNYLHLNSHHKTCFCFIRPPKTMSSGSPSVLVTIQIPTPCSLIGCGGSLECERLNSSFHSPCKRFWHTARFRSSEIGL